MATMRLSTAIRKGAKLHPQTTNALYDSGHTCALGAALVGIGMSEKEIENLVDEDGEYEFLERKFPILTKTVSYPKVNGERKDLGDIIIQLNDDEHWTREKIAQFVRTIEQRFTPKTKTKKKKTVTPVRDWKTSPYQKTEKLQVQRKHY